MEAALKKHDLNKGTGTGTGTTLQAEALYKPAQSQQTQTQQQQSSNVLTNTPRAARPPPGGNQQVSKADQVVALLRRNLNQKDLNRELKENRCRPWQTTISGKK